MKICSLCKVEKEFAEFPARKGSIDGLRRECKACKSKRDSEARAKKMENPPIHPKKWQFNEGWNY